MTTLDQRLLDAGLTITNRLLLNLWADHTPAHLPVPDTCPGCGHTYTTTRPLCPTAAVIRPLLRHRRHEIGLPAITRRLTHNQQQDLLGDRLSTTLTHHCDDPGLPPARPVTPELFDITPHRQSTSKGHPR